jgi:hypothetical protein
MSKLQKKPSALKMRPSNTSKHELLQIFFLLLWVIFALLDPDLDPESGSNPDPDPKPWFKALSEPALIDLSYADVQTCQDPASKQFICEHLISFIFIQGRGERF